MEDLLLLIAQKLRHAFVDLFKSLKPTRGRQERPRVGSSPQAIRRMRHLQAAAHIIDAATLLEQLIGPNQSAKDFVRCRARTDAHGVREGRMERRRSTGFPRRSGLGLLLRSISVDLLIARSPEGVNLHPSNG
jgi:hypothetical protein